ncbi:MAG: CU044_2847 family protein [Methylococcaceae bacterium]
MASELIKLADGTKVEIEIPDNQVKAISNRGGVARNVNTAIDAIKPLILKACKPISEIYKELDKEMTIDQVELELGLGFEAEGDLFITKAKGNANLVVKVTIKPKQN